MTLSSRSRSKVAAVLAAALAGGTVFSTCSGRLKDGVVRGSKDYLASLLDPTQIATLLLEPDDSAESP